MSHCVIHVHTANAPGLQFTLRCQLKTMHVTSTDRDKLKSLEHDHVKRPFFQEQSSSQQLTWKSNISRLNFTANVDVRSFSIPDICPDDFSNLRKWHDTFRESVVESVYLQLLLHSWKRGCPMWMVPCQHRRTFVGNKQKQTNKLLGRGSGSVTPSGLRGSSSVPVVKSSWPL